MRRLSVDESIVKTREQRIKRMNLGLDGQYAVRERPTFLGTLFVNPDGTIRGRITHKGLPHDVEFTEKGGGLDAGCGVMGLLKDRTTGVSVPFEKVSRTTWKGGWSFGGYYDVYATVRHKPRVWLGRHVWGEVETRRTP